MHSPCRGGKTGTGEPGRVSDRIRMQDHLYWRDKCKHLLVEKNLGCETERERELEFRALGVC